jgi:hypothetical protein
MAILSSIEGKLYDLPESEMKKFEVPANKVKDVLAGLEVDAPDGDVEPYGYGYGHWYPPFYFYPRRRRRHHYYHFGY